MQDELERQCGWWMEKDLKSALLEIHQTIMAPKLLTYGMSTNLSRQVLKWKSSNHGLKLYSGEAGIIKRSRGKCMKDQY